MVLPPEVRVPWFHASAYDGVGVSDFHPHVKGSPIVSQPNPRTDGADLLTRQIRKQRNGGNRRPLGLAEPRRQPLHPQARRKKAVTWVKACVWVDSWLGSGHGNGSGMESGSPTGRSKGTPLNETSGMRPLIE